jgi:hypothetical protein
MSADNILPSGMRNEKPGGSDNIKPNDLPYFGLSRFDTRNSNVNKNKDNNNIKTSPKKPYDPDEVLKDQPILKCIFCDEYKTQIEFDLELHLYEMHRWELLTKLPFKGKGYSMDYRTAYVIHMIKTKEKQFEQIRTIQATAQAIATDMKKLIKPSAINDKHGCPDV